MANRTNRVEIKALLRNGAKLRRQYATAFNAKRGVSRLSRRTGEVVRHHVQK